MEEGAVQEVVQQARAGDRQAFSRLYEHFLRRVLGLCRHLLGFTEAAEDAASETFLRVQRSMSQYNNSVPFRVWLLSVASHCCVDQLRRRNLEQRLFEARQDGWPEPASFEPSPLAGILADEERERLRAAIRVLPERFRLVLAMRYEADLSYDQIAAELGLNRNHVATLIFRAKKELRQAFAGAPRERKP